jgi:hypothetical protein
MPLGERVGVLEPRDARAAAADVGLDQQREAQRLRGGRHLRDVVHDAGRRIADAELLEHLDLRRLRDLDRVDRAAVDDRHADALEVAQPGQGVERGLTPAAHVGRWAGAVDDQRERRRALGRIERVARRVDARERERPALEHGEQGAKPVRVLVEDADGRARRHGCRVVIHYNGHRGNPRVSNALSGIRTPAVRRRRASERAAIPRRKTASAATPHALPRHRRSESQRGVSGRGPSTCFALASARRNHEVRALFADGRRPS